MAEKWVVSLGDGTWVEMNERPIVAYLTDEDIEYIESNLGGEFPPDCQNLELPSDPTHIHINELVTNSHWADHTEVGVDNPSPPEKAEEV